MLLKEELKAKVKEAWFTALRNEQKKPYQESVYTDLEKGVVRDIFDDGYDEYIQKLEEMNWSYIADENDRCVKSELESVFRIKEIMNLVERVSEEDPDFDEQEFREELFDETTTELDEEGLTSGFFELEYKFSGSADIRFQVFSTAESDWEKDIDFEALGLDEKDFKDHPTFFNADGVLMDLIRFLGLHPSDVKKLMLEDEDLNPTDTHKKLFLEQYEEIESSFLMLTHATRAPVISSENFVKWVSNLASKREVFYGDLIITARMDGDDFKDLADHLAYVKGNTASNSKSAMDKIKTNFLSVVKLGEGATLLSENGEFSDPLVLEEPLKVVPISLNYDMDFEGDKIEVRMVEAEQQWKWYNLQHCLQAEDKASVEIEKALIVKQIDWTPMKWSRLTEEQKQEMLGLGVELRDYNADDVRLANPEWVEYVKTPEGRNSLVDGLPVALAYLKIMSESFIKDRLYFLRESGVDMRSTHEGQSIGDVLCSISHQNHSNYMSRLDYAWVFEQTGDIKGPDGLTPLMRLMTKPLMGTLESEALSEILSVFEKHFPSLTEPQKVGEVNIPSVESYFKCSEHPIIQKNKLKAIYSEDGVSPAQKAKRAL